MFTGFLFILTLYLQELQGWTPLQAGLITAPASIGAAISLPLASHFYLKIGPKKMLVGGTIFAALTVLPFGFLTAATPLAIIIPLLFLRRLPFSFASVAAQTVIYGPLESSKQGAASSAYNTMRQVAASLGVALIATIQVSQFHSHVNSALADQKLTAPTAAIIRDASQAGYQEAFLACTAIMVIPIVVALFVNNRHAVESMQARVHQQNPVEAEEPIHPDFGGTELQPKPAAGGRS
jgi:MFS family permease